MNINQKIAHEAVLRDLNAFSESLSVLDAQLAQKVKEAAKSLSVIKPKQRIESLSSLIGTVKRLSSVNSLPIHQTLIQDIQNELVMDFLALEGKDQKELLNNARLEEAVKQFDQTFIVDEKRGDHLLLALCRSEDSDVRKLAAICIEQGADVNFLNAKGAHALFLAVSHDDVELAKNLLENGSDLTVVVQGMTPLSFAEQYYKSKTTLLLAKSGGLEKNDPFIAFQIRRFEEKNLEKIHKNLDEFLTADPSKEELAFLWKAFDRALRFTASLKSPRESVDDLFFKALSKIKPEDEFSEELLQALKSQAAHMLEKDFESKAKKYMDQKTIQRLKGTRVFPKDDLPICFYLNNFKQVFGSDDLPMISKELDKFLNTNPNLQELKPLWVAFNQANERVRLDFFGESSELIDDLFLQALRSIELPKEITPEFYQALQFLTTHLKQRDFKGKNDFDIILHLTKTGLIFCCHDYKTHLINLINKSSSIDESIKEKVDLQYGQENVSQFLQFFNLYIKNNDHVQVLLVEPLLKKYFEKLDEAKLPNFSFFQNELERKIAEAKSSEEMQQFKALIQKLKTTKIEDWVILKSLDVNKLKDICFALNEFDVLRALVARERFTVNLSSKLVLHFLLDKLMLQQRNEYTSFLMLFTGKNLIRAIQTVEEDPVIPPLINEKLQKDMIPLIQQCLEWDYALRNLSSSYVVKDIIYKIDNLKVDQNILVPTGSEGHLTCLLIKKNGEEVFRVIQYNTGSGVPSWHNQLGDTNRYQTHVAFDNVPKKSLIDKKKWETLCTEAFLSKNMDSTYETIHQLAKGGVKRDPSGNHFDYEQKQATGTCTAQCFMAFLRHQIMESETKLPEESYAIYKHVKSKMFFRKASEWREQADEVVKKAAATKMKKLEADLKVANLAQDEKAFSSAFQHLRQILIDFNQPDIVGYFDSLPKESIFMRYHILRDASDTIAKYWLSLPHEELKVSKDAEPYLVLALAKYEHQQEILRNMKENAERCLENKDWSGLSFELFNIIVATAHPDWAIDWLIQNYRPEYAEALSDLLNKLANFKPQGSLYIEKIRKAFQEAGQDEAIKLIPKFTPDDNAEIVRFD